MTLVDTFQGLANIFVKNKETELSEYKEFLAFYETLVRTTSPMVANAFGKLVFRVRKGSSIVDYGLLLTPTDYMWWTKILLDNRESFVSPIKDIKFAIINRMSEIAYANVTTIEDKNALLDLLLQVKNEV